MSALTQRLSTHPLFKTLFELKGTPRITVYTEPLFGIPYNLFIPYVSVYMLALGVTDAQIGLLASLGLVVQVFFALISGAVTDKFGRRLTLFVNDILSWSIPCVIWAVAQDFRFFLAAALLNSLWRLSHTAWTCLLVEDAEPQHIHHMWIWVYIFALGSAFVAPLAGLLVERLSIVPAMRWIYAFAAVVLTGKFFILFYFGKETQRGRERREETRNQSIFSLLGEYRGVLGQLLRSRATLIALALMLVMAVYQVINGAFWAVLVTQKLGIPAEDIAYFPLVRSVVMLTVFFLLTPRLDARRPRLPLAGGFAGFLAAQILLVTMPAGSYPLLLLVAALEALSTALVSPMLDSLLVLTMDAGERARLTAIFFVALIVLSSPSGWIAGQLSSIDRTLPFVFNIGLFIVGLGLVWVWRYMARR